MTAAARRYRLGVLEGTVSARRRARGRAGGGRGHGGRRRAADGGLGAAAAGAAAIDEYGTAVPDETLKALAELDGWPLGPHDSASYPEPHRSALNPSGTIRKHFDLFANIRPAKSFEGARAVSSDTDLSSSCARTPRASTPTAAPTPAPASSCRPWTWPSPSASSPGRPSSGSPRSPATWPPAAAGT